jgi:uncharacterized protein (TIGR03437 family)
MRTIISRKAQPVSGYLLFLLQVGASFLHAQTSTTYGISTVAGQLRPTGDGGLASQALLNRPAGLCYDSAGNLYIADRNNFRVRKVDALGKISTVAGVGTYGYTGDDGPAASALIGNPRALVVDSGGNLYIADSAFNVVRKVTSAGTISTIAGTGTSGYTGTGPATSANLNGPSGLALDAAGNLYISETNNNRVMKVSGGIISVYAGSGMNSLSASAGNALGLPLSSPAGLAFDAAGNLYVASQNYAAIMQVTPGGTMSLFAGHGYDGFSDGDGGPANAAHFLSPVALATDANGNLYVADNVAQTIRRINSGGTISGIAGTVYSIGFAGDGGSSTSAQFFQPSGLAIDKLGNLLVSDYGNNRVRKVDPVALTISTSVGTAAQLGDGSSASAAQLLQPSGTGLDATGNLYIADTANHRIRKVDTTGKISTIAGTGIEGYSGDGSAAVAAQLNSPSSVAVDGNGNVLIADSGNSRIRQISPTGNMTTVAGNGTYGFAGDGAGATRAQLANPVCVRVDANNNIYISDSDNGRIRKVNVQGSISTVAGGNGLTYGEGGPAIAAFPFSPGCVAFDSINNLYIADTLHSTVRKVDSTGTITTVAGNTKTFGFTGDGGTATAAALFFPYDIGFDTTGNLFIADTLNARIRKVAANGVISTVAGTGLFGTTGDGGAAAAAQIGEVTSLSIDPKGNLYLADAYNNRVRLLTGQVGPPPDFTFTQDAATKSVVAGSTVSFSFTLSSQNGFSGNVSVAATGLTVGTVTYSPANSATVAAGQGATIKATISIPTSVSSGTIAIGFTATSGTLTHTLSESIVVAPSGPAPPAISSAGVANAASFAGGAVAPGEIVTIYGSGFGPSSIVTLQLDSNGKVVSTLANTTASFNGVSAPVIYVVAGQMSVVVPYEVGGNTTATLQVTYNGTASNVVTVPITDAAPGLFTYNASGSGPLAAANQDGSINTAANPAAVGSIMVFYGTGEGQTSPGGVDGQVASSVFPKPVLPVTATIGGIPATVLYYGAAPGDVSGAFQLNVTIPAGITSGPNPVSFTVGTKSSQTGVTIAVQ